MVAGLWFIKTTVTVAFLRAAVRAFVVSGYMALRHAISVSNHDTFVDGVGDCQGGCCESGDQGEWLHVGA